LISDAERQLDQAIDIIDILEFRDKCQALESILQVQRATYEIQQRVTLLRLKAERKAGYWLQDNMSFGPKGSSSMTLSDLEITKNESSRFQLFAKMPDEKFDAWVDERMAKGWELTISGLISYARNVNGRPQIKTTGPVVLIPKKGTCCLRGFMVECVGDLQGHHIISKNMARGNPDVREILRQCPEEIMADVCVNHNVGKLADSPKARKVLLLQKIMQYGFTHMEEFVDGLPWKVHRHEDTLRAMLDVS
jgi:hypothetical protein